MPLVSLLIPVYNVEDYLEECLESAKNQTLEDIEIICINDGSTDSSREIIQTYLDSDRRFKVIDKPNSGYGSSMNQGLRAASGTFIAILESDDILELDALEALTSLALKNDAQVAKGDFWLYWSTPEVIKKPFEIIPAPLTNRVVNTQAEHDIYYEKPSIWSGIYRRDFLQEHDITFLETPGAAYQDASFNFKVWANATRAVFTTKPVLLYRQDNEASSVNSPGKVFCVCDEYAEMERYLKKRPELEKRLTGVEVRMKFNTYLWNYDRLSEELREQFMPIAAKELEKDMQSGRLDLDLFEPWAEADLRALISNPEGFQEVRAKYAKTGKLNTFKHYYRLGGLPLVAKLAAWKFKK